MHESIEDPLGALVPAGHIRVEGRPEGALHGLTFVAKDNFDLAGQRTGAGHPEWRRTHPPATRTADAIEKLLEAGATLVGKSVLDELAFSLDGENRHDGAPVNSAAPDRVTGGSSSGSASAVAGGLVDFALGTDTGGSVRVPASYCGIWGIRPTHGRVATRGVVPLAESFDTVGWLADSANTLRRVGTVLLDRRRAAPRPRPESLLVADEAFALAGREVRESLRRMVEAVASRLGLPRSAVRPATTTFHELSDWAEAFSILQGVEVGTTHGAWLEAVGPVFGPGVRQRFERALHLAAAASVGPEAERLAAARRRRETVRARLADQLAGGGIIVCPSTPFVAPRRGRSLALSQADRQHLLALTCIAGLAGLPQISMPLVRLADGPVGLSLIGPPHADEALLQWACALE